MPYEHSTLHQGGKNVTCKINNNLNHIKVELLLHITAQFLLCRRFFFYVMQLKVGGFRQQQQLSKRITSHSYVLFTIPEEHTKQSNNKLNRSNCIAINMCVLRTLVLFVSFQLMLFQFFYQCCCCSRCHTKNELKMSFRMENMDYKETAATAAAVVVTTVAAAIITKALIERKRIKESRKRKKEKSESQKKKWNC